MKFISIVIRLVAVISMSLSATTFGATTNLVRMGNFNFTPASITITNGDTILWTNAIITTPIPTPHDTTSSTGLWASTTFNNPGTFSFKFTNAGTYPYFCNFHRTTHPEQTGTITVTTGIPNSLPTVTITNPVNNAVFSAPASFTVGASASDTDGTISFVQFLRNGVSIGVDSTSPYQANVNNLGVGTYNFSAVATDNNNGKATNIISITVLTAPTPVQLLNPSRKGDKIEFSFATEAQRRYSIESTLPGMPFQWGAISNLTGNGSTATVSDALDPNGRFYRVGAQ